MAKLLYWEILQNQRNPVLFSLFISRVEKSIDVIMITRKLVYWALNLGGGYNITHHPAMDEEIPPCEVGIK